MLKTFPDSFVDCVITSPPYWSLRDYGVKPVIWDEEKPCQHIFALRKRRCASDEKVRWCHAQNGQDLPLGKITNPNAQLKSKTAKCHTVQEGFCQYCLAWKGALGLEPKVQLYIQHLCDIFDEVKRVLKPTGVCYVNLGDTYGCSTLGWGSKKPSPTGFQRPSGLDARYPRDPPCARIQPKCLLQIPSRFALEMANRGWILRNEIIWHKPNVIPSSVKDRFTVDYEKIFLFVKETTYHFTQQFEPLAPSTLPRLRGAVGKTHKWVQGAPGQGFQRLFQPRQCNDARTAFPQGRNKRCVWAIPVRPFSGPHFATFPEKLVEPLLLSGCPKGGMVLDPFMGSGTVAVVAKKFGRHYVGIDLNPKYLQMARNRLKETP